MMSITNFCFISAFSIQQQYFHKTFIKHYNRLSTKQYKNVKEYIYIIETRYMTTYVTSTNEEKFSIRCP